ncbi:MAG TPA: AbrB/MazE/SpoVT family DNA-binding domain-containing protein [Thermodesulfobacteriota bacterium]|nr:AbrB/MazE/SpoVT family DNA-binding domain-containing protein [Thermodesulfobacteriota bacterium]
MKISIIKIGNSQGIRIPKAILDQTGLKDEVELQVEKNRIVLSSPKQPRQNWAEAFRSMATHGDDKLLDEDLTGRTEWDTDEWEWR